MNNTYTHIDIQHICTLMYMISPNYMEGVCWYMSEHDESFSKVSLKVLQNI